MNLPENISTLQYCQDNGLRILCMNAFKFFYNGLKDIPGNYLEIGVFEGFMLRELAKKYPDRMFYGIDPFIEDGNTTGHNGIPKGEPMLEQMAATHQNLDGLKNVKFFQQSSRSWGDELDDSSIQSLNIGAILIDGDHGYKEASYDLGLSVRMLCNGGVIFADDSGLPSVNLAVNEFIKKYRSRIERHSMYDHAIIYLKP